MGMMEGTTQLPAVINPDLSSEQRTAAVAEEDYHTACLELAAAGRRWLGHQVSLPRVEHKTRRAIFIDLTLVLCAACCPRGCVAARSWCPSGC